MLVKGELHALDRAAADRGGRAGPRRRTRAGIWSIRAMRSRSILDPRVPRPAPDPAAAAAAGGRGRGGDPMKVTAQRSNVKVRPSSILVARGRRARVAFAAGASAPRIACDGAASQRSRPAIRAAAAAPAAAAAQGGGQGGGGRAHGPRPYAEVITGARPRPRTASSRCIASPTATPTTCSIEIPKKRARTRTFSGTRSSRRRRSAPATAVRPSARASCAGC